MKLILAFALAAILQASPIIGPVASSFKGFEFPCDGLTVGVQPFGCQPGETRRLSDAGEILTGYLFPTHLTPEPPEPTWEPPSVPAPSAAPEPSMLWALTMFGLACGMVWEFRRRKA